MTNIAVKFDNLADKIQKLLDVFEISAKSLAEKDFDFEKENKDIIEKLNEVLEQNKTIARGLTLLHEPTSQAPAPAVEMPYLEPPRAPQRKQLFSFGTKIKPQLLPNQMQRTRDISSGYQPSITQGGVPSPQKPKPRPPFEQEEPDEFSEQYLPEEQGIY